MNELFPCAFIGGIMTICMVKGYRSQAVDKTPPPPVENITIKEGEVSEIKLTGGLLHITVLKLDGVEYYATNTGNRNGWALCPKITKQN